MALPAAKPLGGKAYGHIPHLPGSRMGPGDHHCHEGQARICLERVRDRHDRIVVTEKLDGSNCSVAKLADGQIVALGRAGYLASSSKFEQHQLFADWVRRNHERFDTVLAPGERVCGEWLAQAHGTRYALVHEPYVIFDLFSDGARVTYRECRARVERQGFVTPFLIHEGSPLGIMSAAVLLAPSNHGALDPVEGAVWRVERHGVVDFLARWVRGDKADGCYLPEVSGKDAIWNWRPSA